MSTRVFRHTRYAHNVLSGADMVIADCPIPQGCSQLNVWGEVHCASIEAEALDWDEATSWGLEGWVIPVQDPDTALDLNTLFDQFVPKDTEMTPGSFELNPTTVAASFMDYGEVNIDQIMDMGNLDPQARWYSYSKMLSWANNRVNLVAGSPDTFSVQDVHKIRSRKNMSADVMSWSVLAAGVPTGGDVDASRSTYASEALWAQTKYVDVVLEQAWMELLGLTETGAETPWTEAALAVQDLVEPEPVFVTGALTANWNPCDLHVWCQATFELRVPGRKEIGILAGSR